MIVQAIDDNGRIVAIGSTKYVAAKLNSLSSVQRGRKYTICVPNNSSTRMAKPYDSTQVALNKGWAKSFVRDGDAHVYTSQT